MHPPKQFFWGITLIIVLSFIKLIWSFLFFFLQEMKSTLTTCSLNIKDRSLIDVSVNFFFIFRFLGSRAVKFIFAKMSIWHYIDIQINWHKLCGLFCLAFSYIGICLLFPFLSSLCFATLLRNKMTTIVKYI